LIELLPRDPERVVSFEPLLSLRRWGEVPAWGVLSQFEAVCPKSRIYLFKFDVCKLLYTATPRWYINYCTGHADDSAGGGRLWLLLDLQR
jgi:hypothetical protein